MTPARPVATLAVEKISASVKHRLPFIATPRMAVRQPLLWLPLPGVPKKVAGKRMTPRLFIKTIGTLFWVNRPGRAPLLFGSASGRRGGRVGLASLRRGAAGGGEKVPIFVGVRRVHLGKRIHTNEITAQQAAQIPTA